MPLHRKILIGFVAGASAGLILHGTFPVAPEWLTLFLDYAAEPLGRLFLRLLLMAVLPLVVASLILGVAEMGDAAKLGRVALKTLGFTVLITGISVVTGLVAVNTFRPGDGFPMEIRETMLKSGKMPSVPVAENTNFAQRLLALVPDNPVKAAANGDFLGVMFFSMLFGLGLIRVEKEKAKPLLKFLESVNEASMAFIGLVMKLAPFGVGALVLNLTARFGLGLLRHLFGYALVVVGALAFHQFVTYSILVRTIGGLSPRLFFRRISEAMLTAFGTSSSSATLPVSMRVGEETLGLPREISRFVLTVGASANQNGTALYEGVTALFLAQCFGVVLTLPQQGTVLMLAVLGRRAARGRAPHPRRGPVPRHVPHGAQRDGGPPHRRARGPLRGRGAPSARREAMTMKIAAALLSSLLASSAFAKTVPVELGKPFRLTKADVASIAGGRATLRIVKFINSPCPKGAYCIWSGLAVMTELTVDGKVVPPNAKDWPYEVDTKDSDYRTYAVLVVDDPMRGCEGECLRSQARRRRDPALCRKISDERTRGFCLEDLAEELKDDGLCAAVVTPTQWCLYVKARKSGDLAACSDIVTRRASVRCFKELSTEGGGGPKSCSSLPAAQAKECRETALGPDD